MRGKNEEPYCYYCGYIFLFTVVQVSAAEVEFNPNTQFYDVNGVSKLSLWGVPVTNGQALWADAKDSWQTELSVTAWVAMLLKAQQMGMKVSVGYDPVTFQIWYMSRPRP